MAAARVQSASGNNGSVGGDYFLNFGAGTTFGNLLVICIGGYKGTDWINLPDIQDNLGTSNYTIGFDYIVTNIDRITCYYLPLIPAGITQLIIRQNQPSAAVAMEYSGLLSLVDVVGSAQTQTDTGGVVAWNAAGIRPSTAAGVMIVTAVAQVSPSGFVGTGGFNLISEQDIVAQSISHGVLDQLNAPIAAYYPGGNVNASMQVDSASIAFK